MEKVAYELKSKGKINLEELKIYIGGTPLLQQKNLYVTYKERSAIVLVLRDKKMFIALTGPAHEVRRLKDHLLDMYSLKAVDPGSKIFWEG